jgi:hypothetical protein
MYYIFQSCSLNPEGFPQQTIVQTLPTSWIITPGQTFNYQNICWNFVGVFNSQIPTGPTILTNYSGNFFSSLSSPLIYGNCDACLGGGGTPTQVGCVTYDENIFQTNLPDSCGGYTRVANQVVATLQNTSNGIPVVATSPVTITFEIERNDCLGISIETLTISIPQGQSTGVGYYDSTNCEECQATAVNETVTKSLVQILSITPSSITQCRQ